MFVRVFEIHSAEVRNEWEHVVRALQRSITSVYFLSVRES